MILLCHHLDESLKVEYLTVKDPLGLWISLKGRYDHLKATQQYREIGFQKCSELISCLLVAEPHNDLLMKNHEARPAESDPLPEAHAVEAHGQSGIRQNNWGHDNVHGCDKGIKRYNNRRGGGHNKRENNIGSQNNPSKEKGITIIVVTLKITGKMNIEHLSILSRCIKIPLKEEEKKAGSSQKYNENVEANLALKDDVFDGFDDITHLEAEDFFGDHN
ncbi:hypothetical protein EJD97_010059 [Solanum chilense]|uniref:Uncharacterized protein n=1 Tax=Solanum chilense TaxID=4083 RepID=A0A6N2CGI8_SOLCI|nr:hypothetical protein EJD97_010059 [Solanum chilense]